jgi:hypothetical protein
VISGFSSDQLFFRSAGWPKKTLRDYLRTLRPLCVPLMPKELPGFYFDAEKNRYFPSSSNKEGKSRHPPDARSPAARPHTSDAAAPSHSPSSSTPLPQTRRRSTTDTWHALQQLRLASSPRQRIATTQLRFATLATPHPNSYIPRCVSRMTTAQLEASAAYQAIPFPVFAPGQTLTAFAVRPQLQDILHDHDIYTGRNLRWLPVVHCW